MKREMFPKWANPLYFSRQPLGTNSKITPTVGTHFTLRYYLVCTLLPEQHRNILNTTNRYPIPHSSDESVLTSNANSSRFSKFATRSIICEPIRASHEEFRLLVSNQTLARAHDRNVNKTTLMFTVWLCTKRSRLPFQYVRTKKGVLTCSFLTRFTNK